MITEVDDLLVENIQSGSECGPKFIGTKSRDKRLAMYIDRQYTIEEDGGSIDSIRILVKVYEAGSAKGFRLSLNGRLVADGGLYFVDRTIYQRDHTILFDQVNGNAEEEEVVVPTIFEHIYEADWLPMDGYKCFAFRFHFPRGLADSLTLTPLHSGTLHLNYGLTWYLSVALMNVAMKAERSSRIVHSIIKQSIRGSTHKIENDLNVTERGHNFWNGNQNVQIWTELSSEDKCGRKLFKTPSNTLINVNIKWKGPASDQIQGIRVKGKQCIEILFNNERLRPFEDKLHSVHLKNVWLDTRLSQHQFHSDQGEASISFELQSRQGAYQLALLPKGLLFHRDRSDENLNYPWLAPSINVQPTEGRIRQIVVRYYIKVIAILPWNMRNVELKVPIEVEYDPAGHGHNTNATDYISSPEKKVKTNISPSINREIGKKMDNGDGFESPFEPLTWEEDLQQARNLMISQFEGSLRDLQTCAVISKKHDDSLLWFHVQTMHVNLALAQKQLTHLLQQPLESTTARDTVFLFMDALHNQARGVFCNHELTRGQREQAVHAAKCLYDWLELLLNIDNGDDDEEGGGGRCNLDNPVKLHDIILPQLPLKICSLYKCIPDLFQIMQSILIEPDFTNGSNQEKLISILEDVLSDKQSLHNFGGPLRVLPLINSLQDGQRKKFFIEKVLKWPFY